MRRTAEKVNHLEVLHQVCRRKDWKLLLCSTDDFCTSHVLIPSELVMLDVVGRDGESVLRWPLGDGTTPELAAMALLDGLQRGGLVP